MPLSPAGPRGRCFALASLLVQAACSNDAPAPPPLVMLDSAGIRIVESRAPTWAPGEEWTIAPDPVLVIGQVEGETPYLLSQVIGALRLSDGRIIVANGSTKELRIYDSGGNHLRTVGGAGSGAGKFEDLSSIHLMAGDSVGAWDGTLHRLTIFTPAGDVGREWTVTELAVYMPPIIGIFNDGTLLSSTVRAGASGAAVEEYRDTTLWVRIRPGTTRMDVVGRSLGPEQATISNVSLPQSHQVLFGSTSLAANASDRWFAAESGTYEIRVSSPSGELAAILRRHVEPRPVTSTLLEVQRNTLVAEQERSEADMRRFSEERGGAYTAAGTVGTEELPHREALPFFDRLLVDDEGNLWVRNYLARGEMQQVWSVFDRPGRWLGEVETPAGVDVLAIGNDYLLGGAHDDLGFESVRQFRLSRPARAGDSP